MARNFPDMLRADEGARWRAHCARRLHNGANGSRTLATFFDCIDTLNETADERGKDILEALVDYATEIAAERN